jgi:hypothetical protein
MRDAGGGQEVGVLLLDRASVPNLRPSRRLGVFSRLDHRALHRFPNLFVACTATELPAVARLASAANRAHRLRGLLIRQDVDAEFLGAMLDRARLRLWRNVLVHKGPPVPGRVIRAWEMGAQNDLIAEAALSGGKLFVLTCGLEQLEAPVRQIPALAGLPERDLGAFEVASDGSYIHWPRHDVHLDVDAMRYATDPAWREKADVERATHGKRFGGAVAAFRERSNLRQSDIPGLSERQVRRIEAGAQPRVETLRLLAQAHGLVLSAYLHRVSELATSV